MKKIYIQLTLLFIVLSTFELPAQGENPELIRDRLEAQNLYYNFKNMYNSVEFDENGGSISLASLEALVSQMKQNNSKEIVYRFGRTAPDKSGKNIIMFFNVGYDENQMNNISKIKAVNLCPTNCNANVDDYLK